MSVSSSAISKLSTISIVDGVASSSADAICLSLAFDLVTVVFDSLMPDSLTPDSLTPVPADSGNEACGDFDDDMLLCV